MLMRTDAMGSADINDACHPHRSSDTHTDYCTHKRIEYLIPRNI